MSKFSLIQDGDSKFEYQYMKRYSDMMRSTSGRVGQSITIDPNDPYYFKDGIEEYGEADDYDYKDDYNDASEMPPLSDIYRRDTITSPSFMY